MHHAPILRTLLALGLLAATVGASGCTDEDESPIPTRVTAPTAEAVATATAEATATAAPTTTATPAAPEATAAPGATSTPTTATPDTAATRRATEAPFAVRFEEVFGGRGVGRGVSI